MPARPISIAVKGGRLVGEQQGDGSDVVCIHGMAGDRSEWRDLRDRLTPKHRVTLYDLRGFGDSEAAQGVVYSHTEDLLALLDATGIERASLVGLSMGGSIALNFALNHPGRVERLVLISPAIVGWEWSDDWKTIWRSVAKAVRDGDLVLARERWLAHPMFAAVMRTDAAAHLRRSVNQFHGRQWARDDQRDELSDVERLHELQVPTLLLTGALDAPDMRLIGDLIEAVVPDIRRIDFADAGHMLPLERPAELTEAIAGFL